MSMNSTQTPLSHSAEVDINLDGSDSDLDATNSDRTSLELENYSVSEKRDLGYDRFIILAIALICSVWSAGLIFGWAPLYGTLLRAGIYADLCPVQSPAQNTSHTVPHEPSASTESALCDEQEKRLNLIYTAGSALTQASLFLSGLFLDYQGPKLTSSVSALIVGLGAFLFGASSLWKVDLFILGFALMGFGGAGINLATYTVSNLFPRHKSWVVSSLVGVWTLSSLWFLLLRPAYNVARIPLHGFFFGQAVLLLLTATIFFFTFPNRSLREGEYFTLQQWLPWNAWSHKQLQSVSVRDIPMKTFHDYSQENEPASEQPFTNLPSPDFTSSLNPDYEPSNRPSSDSFDGVPQPIMLLPHEDFTHGWGQFATPEPTEGLKEVDFTSGSDGVYKAAQREPELPAEAVEMVPLDLKHSSSQLSPPDSYTSALDKNRKPVSSSGMDMVKSVLVDVLTMDFILLTVWFAVHVLFFEFYIGTIANALEHRTRQTSYPLGPAVLPKTTPGLAKTIDTYVVSFNVIYAIGFVFVPGYAWTTDQMGFAGSFFLATLLAFAYPLITISPLLPTQFFAYVVYSAALQFVYSCQFGFIAHRFGYHHFGILAGLMGLVAAALIPLQPVFLRLVIHSFNGNFFFMYIIQAAATLPLFGVVVWNWYSSRRSRKLKTPSSSTSHDISRSLELATKPPSHV